jgi:hypothetical protein
MADGIKYPVHISVALDDSRSEWVTVKCDNEKQLKSALIDSHANVELFNSLGIGDTSVDYAKLKALQAEYTNPPTIPADTMNIAMEEYSEFTQIPKVLDKDYWKNKKGKFWTDNARNVKYPGKSKHYYNRQENDVCAHNNHISSNCDDCFDEQIYQHLAEMSRMPFMARIRSFMNKLKLRYKAWKDKRAEERAYNEYMSR